MATTVKAGHYVSGTWRVKPGMEDEFVTRWSDFTGWTKQAMPGARSFVLIRDLEDPQHFISFGVWDDRAAIAAWRDGGEFAKRLAACRELCDDFRASDYELAASH